MSALTPETLVWNLDNSHPDLGVALRAALRDVLDPVGGVEQQPEQRRRAQRPRPGDREPPAGKKASLAASPPSSSTGR